MNVYFTKTEILYFFMFKMHENILWVKIYKDTKLKRLERKKILSII